ncbi:MAG: enoyl-ACP reductase FabI [Solirubrobacteraceae bacterium]|nr:enoyl-ACP reductase FabI [Solirubrobacteraceae bacterium]
MSVPVPSDLLAGRRLLITGVITSDSIGWHVAARAQQAGAEVLLTGFGRPRRLTERAAKQLPTPVEVLELDVNEPDDLAAVAAEIDSRWGVLDGVLHAIAFAPSDALGGNFLETPPDSAKAAFETSAFSLKALAAALLPSLARSEHGGSVVGLDFDAQVAWPIYDWMGVAKAALEATSRYLARYAGPQGVRSNLVSAGPLGTIAARGIPGFARLADGWDAAAPLGWDIADPTPTADAALFLLSPLARAITGEILHVDGGVHASGPVDAGPAPEADDPA